MKKLSKLLIGLLLFTGNILIAQQTSIDSLNNLLSRKLYKNHKEQLNIIDQLCGQYVQTNFEKALAMTKNLLDLSIKYNEPVFKTYALEYFGKIFYLQGKNDSSIYYFTKVLNLRKAGNLKENNLQNKINDTKNNIANVFKVIGRYDTAIVLYNQVRKYYELNNDKVKIGQVLANIGGVYYSAGNLEKAKEYMLLALSMQRVSGDKESLGVSLFNLLVLDFEKKEYPEAIRNGEEAMQIFKHLNYQYYAGTLLRLGACYYQQKQSEKAIQYLNEAMRIYKENDNIAGLMECYSALCGFYLDMKLYKKAKVYGLKSLHIGDTTNRDNLRFTYGVLTKVSIYLNEPTEAIHYFNEHERISEEQCNKGWSEKISDADTKYQTEKKQKEILKLQNEKLMNSLIIKRRNIIIYALFVTICLLFGMAFLIYLNIHNKRIIIEKHLEI